MSITSKITRNRLEKFLEKQQTDKKVLNLGSGSTAYLNFFPNSITCDIDVSKNPDVVADAHNLPFDDEEFDVILCTEVLEHLHTPKHAIDEMKRVLKKDGKLILTTRFIFPIHDAPNDYYRFTKYGLKFLFKDWVIVDIKEETNTFETIAVIFQRLGYQTDIIFSNKLKVIYFIIAKVLSKLNRIIKCEYGDINKDFKENNILTSGYYIVANKK